MLTTTRLLPIELEQALGELVAAGLAHADSFAGLRALLKPAIKRRASLPSRAWRGGTLLHGMDDAGRWTLTPAPVARESGPASSGTGIIDLVAWTLLRRYGVVCWRLLEREADWLPRWHELTRVYHRLEARGEIRGGRFIAGLAGEQFALPEAIPVLRSVRRQPGDGLMIRICGADSLNLVGTLLPGNKIPALPGNRILLRDGLPIATLNGGQFIYATELDASQREMARQRLIHHHQ